MTDHPLTARPAYSIVIPAYNAAGTIAAGLRALQTQTVPRHQYEIIVVDDGSADHTVEVVERFIQSGELAAEVRLPATSFPHDARRKTQDEQATSAHRPSPVVHRPPSIVHRPSPVALNLLRQPHLGAAAARNAGAQAARGDIVIFLDADCVPAPDWLEHLVSVFDVEHVVGAGGRIQTRQQGLIPRFVQLEYDERYNRIGQHRHIDFISSATAAYRREALQAAGGFDTTMRCAEDVDLSFRLAEGGHRLVFVPDAVVYHTHPESLWAYACRKFRYAFWRAMVYSRHPGKVAGDSRTPQTQKLQIALASLIGLGVVGGWVWQPMLPVAGAALGAFLATTTCFVRRVWQTDPVVSLLSPVFLLVSAVAAAAGLTAGVLYRELMVRARVIVQV